MKLRCLLYTVIAALIVVVDQVSKWAVVTHGYTISLTSFLDFELAYNRGIMSGLFHSSSEIVFQCVTLCVLSFLLFFTFITWQQYKAGYKIAGQIFVIAGAFSNVIDRFVHGGVVDFIKIQAYEFIWPVFNIADMCIVFGVVLMLLQESRSSR